MSGYDDALEKLHRANEHRLAFDREWLAFIEQDPYSQHTTFDPESGWHYLVWRARHDPPARRLAVIFADFLANLRGALDYVTWQLVIANNRTPTTRTSFPVSLTPDAWRSAVADRLQGVASAWVSTIDTLQPYHGPTPATHQLAVLDRLNNWSKHQFLPVAITTVQEMRQVLHVQDVPAGNTIEFQASDSDRISDGAVALRYRWREQRQRLRAEPIGNVTFRISFEDDPPSPWDNAALFDWVRRALSRFEAAFADP